MKYSCFFSKKDVLKDVSSVNLGLFNKVADDLLHFVLCVIESSFLKAEWTTEFIADVF